MYLLVTKVLSHPFDVAFRNLHVHKKSRCVTLTELQSDPGEAHLDCILIYVSDLVCEEFILDSCRKT